VGMSNFVVSFVIFKPVSHIIQKKKNVNREKIEKWFEGMNDVRWGYSDKICDIAHSKRLNANGAFLDIFLTETKRKWCDYLLPGVEHYDFIKKYDKYITPKNIDLNQLISEAKTWYEITNEEYDKIFSRKYVGFIGTTSQIKSIIGEWNERRI